MTSEEEQQVFLEKSSVHVCVGGVYIFSPSFSSVPVHYNSDISCMSGVS